MLSVTSYDVSASACWNVKRFKLSLLIRILHLGWF